MNTDDIKLRAVNWEHGMLLTPEHFLREERYFEAGLLWALRYATTGHGLVGAGPRVPEDERGAMKHDPIVVVDQDSESLGISVTQCRALTPAGCIIDIDPGSPVQRRYKKSELDGVAEARVYIVCDPHEKQLADGAIDEFNPQMKTERRPAYWLSLQVHPESAAYSAAVASIRRQPYGPDYEKDADFIPACTTLVAHSELTGAWRKIVDDVTGMTERYTELHRAMREFLVLFAERGIETDVDRETSVFVDRMVVALQACAYDILDPVQAPGAFFGKLRRFFHSAAAYLDLTPAVAQYFETLKETGETEFITLIEQQKKILRSTRTLSVHDNLGEEIRQARGCLGSLLRLERALEGKYINFRVSPSLEAMNFVFDRGGKVLYKLAAKPARVQGVAEELTLYFSQLRMEGREKYRLILAGERGAVFEKGTRIGIEIRINEGSGFRREPINLSCESKLPEQCNFEYDFDAPDVPTITDIRVGLQAHYPIRTALLYIRHRFYAERADEPARAVEPLRSDISATPPAPQGPPYAPAERPARLTRADPPADPRRAGPPAPWESPRRESPDPQTNPPPRRRRLE